MQSVSIVIADKNESPTKSPMKQLPTTTPRTLTGSSATSGLNSKAPTATAKRTSIAGRPPLGSPSATATKGPRTSLTGSSARPAPPRSGAPPARPTPSTAGRRISLKPGAVRKPSETPESQPTPQSDGDESLALDDDSSSLPAPKPAGTGKPPAGMRVPSGNNANLKDLEDLKTKLRVMEKKRIEDREKLKSLETLSADRNKFQEIIQKLQAKYQPQQQEVTDLRKQVKELEELLEQADKRQAEHESILEMAALDREMAEEVADSIKAEYEALRTKAEEMQLEVEILREENEELGQVTSPEERSSQGWLQLERTNERLREALIRLRDVTQQQEEDLRNQIKELQDDMEDYGSIKAQYESTKEQLMVSEANMEDLKQQVEALGAEDMIEELSEKNMQNQEQIAELKAVIEDLESLKEISDELEVNHIESEKQLQEEIDFRESLHFEQARRITQQDEIIRDLEYTLSKFRELVTTLQSDLEDMRVSQQLTESETNELTARSRAMIDLNMKLQTSVSKSQNKTIDVELGRLEADESAQHLSIMKLYLPEYYDTERNPILALLRFRRLGFKAALVNSAIKERMVDSTPATIGQDIFTEFDILDKLTLISSLCDRFINFIGACSAEQFLSFEGALFELEPVERILNALIDGLKKSELEEKRSALELQRSIALLSHLAETLIPSTVETYADELVLESIMIQTYLDQSASALAYLRTQLSKKLTISQDDEEGPFLFQKLDILGGQARGGKVIAGKITRSLDELKSRSLALSKESGSIFEKTETAARQVAELSRQLGAHVTELFEEDGRTEPVTYAELTDVMQKAVSEVSLLQSEDETDPLASFGKSLRALSGYLEELGSVSFDLLQTVEFERSPAPWTIRSKELRSNKVISPDADEEIRRLKRELAEASAALGVKDRIFEEQTIKIELLESRMRDSNKKVARFKELEAGLEEQKAKEAEFLDVVEKQSRDLHTLEHERNDAQARLDKAKRASASTTSGADSAGGAIPASAHLTEAASATIHHENDVLRSEIASLQAAVRYLRDENRRANLLDPVAVQRAHATRTWLEAPLVPPRQAGSRAQTSAQTASAAVASESQDVLAHLVKLAQETNVVDLRASISDNSTTAHSRLAWKPFRSTPRYRILRQREDFEAWASWKDDVAARERESRRQRPVYRTLSEYYAFVYPPDIRAEAGADGEDVAPATSSLESSTEHHVSGDHRQSFLHSLLPTSPQRLSIKSDHASLSGDNTPSRGVPARGKAMMDRAWKLLGIQQKDVEMQGEEEGGNAAGVDGVKVVGS